MKIQVIQDGSPIDDPSEYAWLSEAIAIQYVDRYASDEIKDAVTVEFHLLDDGALNIDFAGPKDLARKARKIYFEVGNQVLFPESALESYLRQLPGAEVLRDEWKETGRHTFPQADPQIEVQYERVAPTPLPDQSRDLRLEAFICRTPEEAANAFPPFEFEYEDEIEIRNGRARELWPGASAYCANLDFLEKNGEEVRFSFANVVWHLDESPFAVEFATRFKAQLEAASL